MRKIILATPLLTLIIICIFVLIFILTEKDPQKPPSALIDQDLPLFKLTNLYERNETIKSADLQNQYTLINFFASWCAPCKLEHSLFFDIKKDSANLFILGINYKDKQKDAESYLELEGNPYSFVGMDLNGKIGFEFGVFGLPETFLVNNKGEIIYKHIGPLTKEIYYEKIKPLL